MALVYGLLFRPRTKAPELGRRCYRDKFQPSRDQVIRRISILILPLKQQSKRASRVKILWPSWANYLRRSHESTDGNYLDTTTTYHKSEIPAISTSTFPIHYDISWRSFFACHTISSTISIRSWGERSHIVRSYAGSNISSSTRFQHIDYSTVVATFSCDIYAATISMRNFGPQFATHQHNGASHSQCSFEKCGSASLLR